MTLALRDAAGVVDMVGDGDADLVILAVTDNDGDTDGLRVTVADADGTNIALEIVTEATPATLSNEFTNTVIWPLGSVQF